VAEDNVLNQKLLGIILNRQKAMVTQAFTGQEAIGFLQRQTFDVILMDLQMPEVDGFETTAYIRRTMKNDVPIIALTAGLFEEESQKCMEMGMDACISKPIEAEHLYSYIRTIIENNKKIKAMGTPSLDLSYLTSLAGNDKGYMYQVLTIFLNTVQPALVNLERMVRETDDFDGIHRQAHSLKSSFSVVKVDNIFDDINQINILARNGGGKPEITELLDRVLVSFKAALPLIVAEVEKYNPANN
jgi:CheY-like chemotaxis protein